MKFQEQNKRGMRISFATDKFLTWGVEYKMESMYPIWDWYKYPSLGQYDQSRIFWYRDMAGWGLQLAMITIAISWGVRTSFKFLLEAVIS